MIHSRSSNALYALKCGYLRCCRLAGRQVTVPLCSSLKQVLAGMLYDNIADPKEGAAGVDFQV